MFPHGLIFMVHIYYFFVLEKYKIDFKTYLEKNTLFIHERLKVLLMVLFITLE